MQVVHYTISVRGAATRPLTVDITVHGPIMTQAGQTTSVDWMGNVPSPDLAAILAVDQAASFSQFKAALAGWYAPTQNFVYADTAREHRRDLGGLLSPGRRGLPAVAADERHRRLRRHRRHPVRRPSPQVYDPPSHVLATANQRPVTAAYPYYIGTTADFFDPGYRAATIYAACASGSARRSRRPVSPRCRPA